MVSKQMIKTAAKNAWDAKQLQRAQNWVNNNFDVDGVDDVLRQLDTLIKKSEELSAARQKLGDEIDDLFSEIIQNFVTSGNGSVDYLRSNMWEKMDDSDYNDIVNLFKWYKSITEKVKYITERADGAE